MERKMEHKNVSGKCCLFPNLEYLQSEAPAVLRLSWTQGWRRLPPGTEANAWRLTFRGSCACSAADRKGRPSGEEQSPQSP